MSKIFLPLGSLLAGALIGSILTVNASLGIAKYLSIAILAALDSVLGGARALLEDNFDSLIMLSGFFVNALLAMLLAFLGDQIGIDMFMAASICFALRIFSNLAFIRRDIITTYRRKYAAKQAAAHSQQHVRLISAPAASNGAPKNAAEKENRDAAEPNLENTITGLLMDVMPLAEPEEPDLDQTPVKVRAIISPDKADKKNEENN